MIVLGLHGGVTLGQHEPAAALVTPPFKWHSKEI